MGNIIKNRRDHLLEFCERLNYRFNDVSLFEQALIHRSFLNEAGDKNLVSNERMEFLGDAVLELVVSDILYRKFPSASEGDLTRRRSQMVCELSFAHIASHYNIGQLILMGKGEERTGGRKKASILSDTFEAITGAIYLDGGYQWIYDYFQENFHRIMLDEENSDQAFVDYKTRVQEHFHTTGQKFEYRLEKEEGPAHEKTFTMALYVDGEKQAEASEKNKKLAEQAAAKKLSDKLGL